MILGGTITTRNMKDIGFVLDSKLDASMRSRDEVACELRGQLLLIPAHCISVPEDCQSRGRCSWLTLAWLSAFFKYALHILVMAPNGAGQSGKPGVSDSMCYYDPHIDTIP
jgi:hypothetical protein